MQWPFFPAKTLDINMLALHTPHLLSIKLQSYLMVFFLNFKELNGIGPIRLWNHLSLPTTSAVLKGGPLG